MKALATDAAIQTLERFTIGFAVVVAAVIIFFILLGANS